MDRRKTLLLLGGLGATAFAGRSIQRAAAARAAFLGSTGFPYEAFDALPATDLPVGAATIHVAFAPGGLALAPQQILDWVRHAATAVATYYGRFPVSSVRLLIVPMGGGGVQGGTTWGYNGAAIRILLGSECDAAGLKRDWMMTHEFVHTALPEMSYRYNWLSEGLAVYVEPIARVQAGYLKPSWIWADMARDMPKGLPVLGDAGLDNTPTWGRTYWGGAIFCLLADLGIRQRTKNRKGLQDAMRGVLAAGGSHEVEWPIRKILATADRTVGETVMTDLYERMRAKSDPVDLAEIWKELGIEATEEGVTLHDDAPLAPIRLAITARPAAG